MRDQTLEIALTVPRSEEEHTFVLLSKEFTLNAEIIRSAGIEGGGGLSSLVVTLGKATLGPVANVVSRLASGHEITLQVGQTTLHATRLRDPDLVSLLEKVLETELKRIVTDKKTSGT